MKVFISWSGELSRAIAAELREWLPMVVQQVDPWMSKRDIEPGLRWAHVLGQELEQSDFAILCLTKENMNSPWILFEAGAVARSLKARVVPLLWDIEPRDLNDPLSQFQSISLNKDGIKELVYSLYSESNSGLQEKKREIVFATLWHLLEDRIKVLKLQATTSEIIESPIDIINEATTAFEPSLTKSTDAKKLMESIETEQIRLSQELEYLKKEDEKLTKQDAPISLERAIQPVEKRLNKIAITLETILDLSFSSITPSQIKLLQSLVDTNARRINRALEEFPMETRVDLDVLSDRALVTLDKDGVILIHDLVADYVLKKFPKK
jgi:hypothetical protein